MNPILFNMRNECKAEPVIINTQAERDDALILTYEAYDVCEVI